MRRAAVACAALAVLLAAPAEAKPARCFTSDDGTYACDFRGFDGNGSFRISAPMRPTYTLAIVRRGVADAFADFGTRAMALPGPFFRSREDPACWVSDATGFTLCAY